MCMYACMLVCLWMNIHMCVQRFSDLTGHKVEKEDVDDGVCVYACMHACLYACGCTYICVFSNLATLQGTRWRRRTYMMRCVCMNICMHACMLGDAYTYVCSAI